MTAKDAKRVAAKAIARAAAAAERAAERTAANNERALVKQVARAAAAERTAAKAVAAAERAAIRDASRAVAGDRTHSNQYSTVQLWRSVLSRRCPLESPRARAKRPVRPRRVCNTGDRPRLHVAGVRFCFQCNLIVIRLRQEPQLARLPRYFALRLKTAAPFVAAAAKDAAASERALIKAVAAAGRAATRDAATAERALARQWMKLTEVRYHCEPAALQ